MSPRPASPYSLEPESSPHADHRAISSMVRAVLSGLADQGPNAASSSSNPGLLAPPPTIEEVGSSSLEAKQRRVLAVERLHQKRSNSKKTNEALLVGSAPSSTLPIIQ